MLDREYKFYQDHKNELLATHYGQWAVITGESVHGIYETKELAYKEGATKLGLGNFFLQHLLEDALLAVTFYSRVYA